MNVLHKINNIITDNVQCLIVETHGFQFEFYTFLVVLQCVQCGSPTLKLLDPLPLLMKEKHVIWQ